MESILLLAFLCCMKECRWDIPGHGDIAATRILSLVMLLVMQALIVYCIFLQHVKNWIAGSLVMLLLIRLRSKEMISGIILTKINT